MCRLVSNSCHQSRPNRKSSSLRNYTSLLSLNKQRNSCVGPLASPSNGSRLNCLSAKSIAILTLHFVFVYVSIWAFDHPNLSELFNYTKIIASVYLVFYLLIILFPGLRFQRPFNFTLFTFYTVLASILYSALAIHSAHFKFVRFAILIILVGHIFLVLFCLQSTFTLSSRPLLPYLFVFSVLTSFLIILALIIYFCLKHHVYFGLFDNLIFFKGKTFDTVDLKSICLSVSISCLFICYEIFDLQYVLGHAGSTCQDLDYFTIAFNLISVDYFKIALMFIRYVLELIK